MSQWTAYTSHRPVLQAGVQGPEPTPLADWSTWSEALKVLVDMGFAFYAFNCILVLHPACTIEQEITYG